MSADFSSENMELHLSSVKESYHLLILYMEKLTFRNQEEMKMLSYEGHWKELLPADLPLKNGQREFFEQKGNDESILEYLGKEEW